MTVPVPDVPDAVEAPIAAAAPIKDRLGRVLGEKALVTRLRLLEALGRELAEKRYRDITLVRVAFRGGCSSANFYLYFPELETAVLALAALYDGEDTSLPPHVRRVIDLIRAEDQMLAVTRRPEPDTRLELLAALTARGGEWTADDVGQAFGLLGFAVTPEQCDALLARLADSGRLWPITPSGASPTSWVRTKPPTAAA